MFFIWSRVVKTSEKKTIKEFSTANTIDQAIEKPIRMQINCPMAKDDPIIDSNNFLFPIFICSSSLNDAIMSKVTSSRHRKEEKTEPDKIDSGSNQRKQKKKLNNWNVCQATMWACVIACCWNYAIHCAINTKTISNGSVHIVLFLCWSLESDRIQDQWIEWVVVIFFCWVFEHDISMAAVCA